MLVGLVLRARTTQTQTVIFANDSVLCVVQREALLKVCEDSGASPIIRKVVAERLQRADTAAPL